MTEPAMTVPAERPFIPGQRCHLRPLVRADLDGNWRHWLNDPEVTRYMFRGAFPASAESNEEFYESVHNSPNDLVLAIVSADDDVHVGNTGLHRIDWVNRSAEFGILIGEKDYWGRGIGSEATTNIVRHGFEQLNLHRIWLGVFAEHESAVGVYERVGFRREGTLREAILRDGETQDQLIMGLLAREFRGADAR
jgi:ribosomal-protein-alanine N-acetyltransferase